MCEFGFSGLLPFPAFVTITLPPRHIEGIQIPFYERKLFKKVLSSTINTNTKLKSFKRRKKLQQTCSNFHKIIKIVPKRKTESKIIDGNFKEQFSLTKCFE